MRFPELRKLPISRRIIVHFVQMNTLRESVLTTPQKRGDQWGEAVISKLSMVTDLVASDAMYHAVKKAGLKCTIICKNCHE